MRKTVMIGLDGCDFRILEPLVREGALPTFGRLMSKGCMGNLLSTLPSNTLPSWNSIFTGVNPGKHGITDFMLREGDGFRIANASYRTVDPIWRIISDRNIRQIVVNEPVTFPPLAINGVMVSGFSVPPGERSYCSPHGIQLELDEACGRYMPELPPQFESTIAHDRSLGMEMIDHFARSTFDATMYLMRKYEWQLLATIFTSTDRFQHFYLDDQNAIRAHYKLLDGFIKRILDESPDANVMLLSDHGFGPIRNCFYINSWLKSIGILKERKSIARSILSRTGISVATLVPLLSKIGLYKLVSRLTPRSLKKAIPESSHEERFDSEQSKIFMPSLGSGVFVKSGVPDETVTRIKNELSSLSFGGQQIVESILPKEDAAWGPFSHRSGDFHLVPTYGCEISHRMVQNYFEPPSRSGDIRTGTHRREGIFIAYGPDFDVGVTIEESLYSWDIAPTLLHLMGLPIPDYMDGRVIKRAFKNGSAPKSSEVKILSFGQRERIRARLHRSIRKIE